MDPRTPVSDMDRVGYELGALKTRIDELAAPSGTALYQTVAKLKALVEDIQQQLDDYIANSAYTKAQVDAKVAAPGAIAPTTVTASGAIVGASHSGGSGTFPSGVFSTDSYNRLVTGGGSYRALWVHQDGSYGYAPSSKRFKTAGAPFAVTVEQALELQAVIFQYLVTPPYATADVLGLFAEDVEAAGFGWLIDYDEDGQPFGVRYDLVALIVLEGMRDLYHRVELKGESAHAD